MATKVVSRVASETPEAKAAFDPSDSSGEDENDPSLSAIDVLIRRQRRSTKALTRRAEEQKVIRSLEESTKKLLHSSHTGCQHQYDRDMPKHGIVRGMFCSKDRLTGGAFCRTHDKRATAKGRTLEKRDTVKAEPKKRREVTRKSRSEKKKLNRKSKAKPNDLDSVPLVDADLLALLNPPPEVPVVESAASVSVEPPASAVPAVESAASVSVERPPSRKHNIPSEDLPIDGELNRLFGQVEIEEKPTPMEVDQEAVANLPSFEDWSKDSEQVVLLKKKLATLDAEDRRIKVEQAKERELDAKRLADLEDQELERRMLALRSK